MNRFLNSLLKTGVYLLNQYYEQVDRASERVSDLVDRGKDLVLEPKDHTLRNIITFAAGMGVGVGAGLLFAPASGSDTRSSLREKVQDLGRRAS